MTCIICKGHIIRSCKCLRNDKLCENGHEYHYCNTTREYHEGPANHGSSECCESQKVISKEEPGDHEV